MQIVLQQVGTTLAKKANAFEVRSADGSHRISPTRCDSLLISPGIKLTSDAMLLAVKHKIDIILVDGMGNPQGRVWSNQYGSISSIRKHQVYFANSPEGCRWIAGMIRRRLTGQQELLQTLARDRPRFLNQVEPAIQTLDSLCLKFEDIGHTALEESVNARLRGWEGAGSNVYFSALDNILPAEYKFGKRSRRPARDMFNCALNYLYGMLYGRIEGALIKAGIDPYLGIFHRDEHNRPVLVYDMIEPFRVWAESVLLSLCFHHAIGIEMFSRKKNGYWLEIPGKQLIIGAMNDYLAEVKQMNGKRRSRMVHIQDECYALAKTMLNFDPEQGKSAGT